MQRCFLVKHGSCSLYPLNQAHSTAGPPVSSPNTITQLRHASLQRRHDWCANGSGSIQRHYSTKHTNCAIEEKKKPRTAGQNFCRKQSIIRELAKLAACCHTRSPNRKPSSDEGCLKDCGGGTSHTDLTQQRAAPKHPNVWSSTYFISQQVSLSALT